jgi:DME family drug/metabolite transporter
MTGEGSGSTRAVTFTLLGAALFGTAGTAAALAPEGASPAALGALRMIIGALVLVAFVPLLGGSWRRLPALARRPAVWIMAATSAAYQPLFFGAVDRAGVALSTLLAVGATPIFSGLLGRVLLRQPLTRAWLGATLLAVSGLVLRSWGQFEAGELLGLVMAVTAGFSSACYMVAAKGELNRGAHAVELPGVAYLIGSIALLPILVTQPLGWIATPQGIAVAAYLGAVTMALANVNVIIGLRGMPPGPASTLLLADPLTATVLGVLVLGETITWLGIAGLILVLAGLVMQARALARTSKPERELAPVL